MADLMYVKETAVLNKDDTITVSGTTDAWHKVRVYNLSSALAAEVSVVHAGDTDDDAWSLHLGSYSGDMASSWLYLQTGAVVTGVAGEAHVVVL